MYVVRNINRSEGFVDVKGFRSYFQECAPEFTLLEPLSTFETRTPAQEMREKWIRVPPTWRAFSYPAGVFRAPLRAYGAPEWPAGSLLSATK